MTTDARYSVSPGAPTALSTRGFSHERWYLTRGFPNAPGSKIEAVFASRDLAIQTRDRLNAALALGESPDDFSATFPSFGQIEAKVSAVTPEALEMLASLLGPGAVSFTTTREGLASFLDRVALAGLSCRVEQAQ